jgi:hypothetical protein
VIFAHRAVRVRIRQEIAATPNPSMPRPLSSHTMSPHAERSQGRDGFAKRSHEMENAISTVTNNGDMTCAIIALIAFVFGALAGGAIVALAMNSSSEQY